MKNVAHVAIVGAGQLGSRHLQGLSQVTVPIKISVVDPIPEALATSQSRYAEMPFNENVKEISFNSRLSDVSGSIDLAIVATNSNIRARIAESLIKDFGVKSMILEKVLFQREAEYEEIGALLFNNGAKAWVNHSRRMLSRYKELKIFLSDKGPISYEVRGGSWGLACNGLHFLDHLAYLSASDELEVSTAGLDKTIVKSKRNGFVEVNGCLTGAIGLNLFSLHCNSSNEKLKISIETAAVRITIDESAGIIEKNVSGDFFLEEGRIIYFQSELTNILVEDILANGICDLPSYAEATKLHLPYIKALAEHINRFDSIVHIGCPIT